MRSEGPLSAPQVEEKVPLALLALTATLDVMSNFLG